MAEKTDTADQPRTPGRPRSDLPGGIDNPNPLARWMAAKGVTVESLAAIMDVSRGAVYGWRRGDRPPSRKRIAKLAEITDGAVSAKDWA